MIRIPTLCLMIAGAMGVAGCERVLDRALNRPSGEITLPPPPPERLARPVFVVVEGDRIIAEMDDGAQCLGNARAAFTAAGWTGTLSECPYPYTYAVALAAGMPADVIPLNEVIGVPLPSEEGEVPFRPIASVRITDTGGFTYRFESAEGF
jgi:hypothetical protein